MMPASVARYCCTIDNGFVAGDNHLRYHGTPGRAPDSGARLVASRAGYGVAPMNSSAASMQPKSFGVAK